MFLLLAALLTAQAQNVTVPGTEPPLTIRLPEAPVDEQGTLEGMSPWTATVNDTSTVLVTIWNREMFTRLRVYRTPHQPEVLKIREDFLNRLHADANQEFEDAKLELEEARKDLSPEKDKFAAAQGPLGGFLEDAAALLTLRKAVFAFDNAQLDLEAFQAGIEEAEKSKAEIEKVMNSGDVTSKEGQAVRQTALDKVEGELAVLTKGQVTAKQELDASLKGILPSLALGLVSDMMLTDSQSDADKAALAEQLAERIAVYNDALNALGDAENRVLRAVHNLTDAEYNTPAIVGLELADIRATEHEKLGDVLRASHTFHDSFIGQDYFIEWAFFSIGGSGIKLWAQSSESAEQAAAAMDAVLDMMDPVGAALTSEELPKGSVETPGGYRFSLPENWRGLTNIETAARDGRKVLDGSYADKLASYYVVDTRYVDRTVFSCHVDSSAQLHVLDPEKSPASAKNFEAYAEIFLKGGAFRLHSGGKSHFVQTETDVALDIQKRDDLRFLKLSDREAYMLRLYGVDNPEDPEEKQTYAASVFFTTYGGLGLTCAAVIDQEHPADLEAFETTVQKIEILDGANHPMVLSTAAKYTRWWPFANPFLQLYFLPIPLIAFGAWFVYKSD